MNAFFTNLYSFLFLPILNVCKRQCFSFPFFYEKTKKQKLSEKSAFEEIMNK